MFRALRTVVRSPFAATLPPLLLLLTGCASGPGLARVVTIEDGQPVVVVYEPRQQGGRKQTLLTTGVVDPSELYSSRSSDPLAKVMTTEQMQVTLDALATYGFFDNARTFEAPGAVSNLRVTVDGREQVWSKVPSMAEGELIQYHQAMGAFLDLWNGTESFHSSRGGEAVLDEAERLRQRYERMQLESGRTPETGPKKGQS